MRIGFLLGKILGLFALFMLLQACDQNLLATPVADPPVTVIPSVIADPRFDGERALKHISTQLDFGPRTPGSAGHDMIISWIKEELDATNWEVSVQEIPYGGYMIQNVIAKRGAGDSWILLGAHYDTRLFSDRDPDPDLRKQPVPGANDGASGVAVLMELARVLPEDLAGEVWLVFFDAEDNGRIPGWDWILGSQAFVNALEGQPDAVVVVDMVGDVQQEIYWEKNSDPWLNQEIWQLAEELGYDSRFIPQSKHSVLDDHTSFLQAGIPAIDIIDFDYPAWHTTGDTIDKVSSRSLEVVGEVLYHWLMTKLE